MLAMVRRWRAKEGLKRTAGEESVFGEDGYGVHEQYRDWKGGLLVYAVPPFSGCMAVELLTLEQTAEGEE